MTGRFSPGKGHEEFLSSAKISDKFKNLKFIIVGEASRGEEQYNRNIKSLAEELNLKNIPFGI